MDKLILAATKAGLPFTYNPDLRAFESGRLRVTMCAAPYKILDFHRHGPPIYLHMPELVVEFIKCYNEVQR